LRKLSRIFAVSAVLCFTLALLTPIIDGSAPFQSATGFLYLDYHGTLGDHDETLILYN